MLICVMLLVLRINRNANFEEVCNLSIKVIGGTILQQVFVVEFTVNNQMCSDCHRVEAKDFWKAVVQVRQKVCIMTA